MQRNGVVVLVSVALLSVAGIVAAYFFTHEPEPEPMSAYDRAVQQAHEAKIACIESGGNWTVPVGGTVGSGTCEHSNVEPTAPPVEAPSTSGGGGSGGKTAQELFSPTAEQIVDEIFSASEQRGFCSAVEQVGYTAALRAWKRGYDRHTNPSAEEVFIEAFSQCL
jgi:hypothetical protein